MQIIVGLELPTRFAGPRRASQLLGKQAGGSSKSPRRVGISEILGLSALVSPGQPRLGLSSDLSAVANVASLQRNSPTLATGSM